MFYFSTNRRSPIVSFREAVLAGQPEDRGLYFPKQIPQFSDDFLRALNDLSNDEIAFTVIKPYVSDAIPDDVLLNICSETVNFPFPLVEISDRIFALELFHGPTLAFKDVGARFMSRCLQYFARWQDKKNVVIVATSGDTGGAVAAGFHCVDGIEVTILYPKGRVSKVQEMQLTTLGGNVTAFEVDGSFDDCQAMAKKALADPDLKGRANFTSANSINIARWLPQQFYYFFALKQWKGGAPVISVPSGNFGNLASGILAYRSGLPVKKFIAACNANDVVPRFLDSGEYKPRPSVSTLSNAMDVGDPSNFVRILEMLGDNGQVLKEGLEAVSISDEVTAETMREVYRASGYVLDPHGAVGFHALEDHLRNHPDERGIFLETAHPVKFDSVETILGAAGGVPEAITSLFGRAKQSIAIKSNYNELKDILAHKI
jgi:threonine synthase